MKLPSISLNPSTHIAYFPYEMLVKTRTANFDKKEQKPLSAPGSGTHPQTSAPDQQVSVHKDKGAKLFENTLVGHFYTLFTSPVT